MALNLHWFYLNHLSSSSSCGSSFAFHKPLYMLWLRMTVFVTKALEPSPLHLKFSAPLIGQNSILCTKKEKRKMMQNRGELQGEQGRRNGRDREIKDYLKIGLMPNSDPGGKRSRRVLREKLKESLETQFH